MNTPAKLHVVGLTGGIASGKSTVREELAKGDSVKVLDADKLGHLAYAPGTATLQKLVDEFGSGILASDGGVDRPKLGGIVFGNPEKLKMLNKIVWPAIRELALNEMKACENKVSLFIFEAAVLVEAEWTDIVDEVWVVQSALAKERLMARNKLSDADAEARIQAQRAIHEKRLEKAHVIINNDGDFDTLRQTIEDGKKGLDSRLCSLTSNGSELVDIVDRFKNTVIDVRKRAVVRAFNLPHRATYVVILHEPTGKFVVQQRSASKEYAPLMFDPCPGGVVEASETYQINALKEMEEELGMKGVPLKDQGEIWFESDRVRCWGKIFLCRTNLDFPSGFKLQESEVADILLMTKDEILQKHRSQMTPDGLYAFEYYCLNRTSRV